MNPQLNHRAFLLLLALVSIAFFWVLLPFYGAVLWAVILAIIFRPLHRRLEILLGRRKNLAAALSVLTCILIAILPVSLVVASLVNQATAFVDLIRAGQFPASSVGATLFDWLPGWAQDALAGAGITDFADIRERFADALSQVGQFLATQAMNLGQNTLHFIASLGVMLYLLFFLFRDGPQIGHSVRVALPLSPDVSRGLLGRFATVVRATVKGNLIIAAIQGGIGGVTFALLGIPGAVLWGAIMMFLSLLPAVGAALVWVPVAAYMILAGDYISAAILIVVGVGIIGLVDNLLRPPLVGRGVRLPDYVILISTLGGLAVFGINGFVLGPLIAALFVACWTLYRDELDDPPPNT